MLALPFSIPIIPQTPFPATIFIPRESKERKSGTTFDGLLFSGKRFIYSERSPLGIANAITSLPLPEGEERRLSTQVSPAGTGRMPSIS